MKYQDLIHAVFFAASIQGLMMALVFFKKSKKDQVYRFLTGIFLIFSLVLLYWVGYWTGLYSNFAPAFSSIIDPLDLLLAPFIYLFLKSLLTEGFKFKKIHLLHVLPFAIFWVLSILKFIHINSETGIIDISHLGLRTYTLIYTISKNIQFLGYLIWLVIMIRSSRTWLNRLIIPFIVFFTGRILFTVSVFAGFITPAWDYSLSFIISSAVFILAYLNHVSPIHLREKKVYAKSSLSQNHEPLICDKVLNHIKTNKRFLDHEYSINELAKETSISRHHISQALNQHLGKSFSVLINELRIQESMQILKNPEKADDKIISIAYQSGFSNKVSFNQYFKRTTGTSPAEYRKSFMKAS